MDKQKQSEENYGSIQIMLERDKYEDNIQDFDSQIELINNLINQNENNSHLYFQRGLLFVQNYFLNKAIDDFTKVIEIDEYNYLAYYNRANVNFLLKNFSISLEDLELLNGKENKIIEISYLRGKVLFELNRFSESIIELTKYIKLNPEDDSSYFYRGFSQYGLKKYSAAIDDLKKSIDLCPNNARYFYTLGGVYMNISEFKLAIHYFSQTIELKPNHSFAFYYRAKCYLILEDDAKAKHDLDMAIYFRPDNPGCFFERAKLFKKLHEFKQAKDDFTRAIKYSTTDKERMEMYYLRALVNIDLHLYNDALEDLNQIKESEEYRVKIQLERSNIFYKLNKYNTALSFINKVLQIEGENVLALKNRGLINMKLNNLFGAEKDFNNAIIEIIKKYPCIGEKSFEINSSKDDLICDYEIKIPEGGIVKIYFESLFALAEINITKCEYNLAVKNVNRILVVKFLYYIEQNISIENFVLIKEYDFLSSDYKGTNNINEIFEVISNKKNNFKKNISNIVDIEPYLHRLFLLRAIAHYNLKDLIKSICDLSYSVFLNSNDSKTYFYMGLIFKDLGMLEQALDYFNESFILGNSDALDYINSIDSKIN